MFNWQNILNFQKLLHIPTQCKVPTNMTTRLYVFSHHKNDNAMDCELYETKTIELLHG